MNHSNDQSARARKLRDQGWSIHDIATVLQVPATTIEGWLTPAPEPPTPVLGFDEWVQYLFDNPPDYRWLDHLMIGDELPSTTLVAYLTRLFAGAGTILAPFSDAQINQTLWFLIGEGSDGAFALFDETVPWPARRACIVSTLSLFKDCFLPRCTPALSHRDEPASPLNSICYMWWDLFPTWGSPGDAGRAELDALILEVMQSILELPSDACRESALHGLGHWMPRYPEQVEVIIDAWLGNRTTVRPELRSYALAARGGCIQ